MLPEISYQMSFLAVLASSLIGSTHCAAMCGGFVTMVNAPGVRGSTQSLYHIGRLTTYLALGALFGAIGHTLDQNALRYGVSNAAAFLVGGYLIITGIRGLRGASAGTTPILPGPLGRFFARIIRGENLNPGVRAYLIGFFTTFLPCGWLYTFAALAALSGGAAAGMAIMLAFWLGTVPILAALGEVGRRASKAGWKIAPRTTYAIITLLGIATIAIHLRPHDHAAMNHDHGAMQHQAADPHQGMNHGEMPDHSQHQMHDVVSPAPEKVIDHSQHMMQGMKSPEPEKVIDHSEHMMQDAPPPADEHAEHMQHGSH